MGRDGFFEYSEAVLVAILLALFAKAFVFEAFEIPSGSMETTVLIGDRVLVNKFAYGPHRGPWAAALPYRDVSFQDVAVFRYPEDPQIDFIKRIVGLPQDRIEIRGKKLTRNGFPVAEPYARFTDAEVYSRSTGAPDSLARRDEFGPYTIPDGRYLALGDNRDGSRDSRVWGMVPEGHVKGRAVLVYLSIEPSRRSFTGRGAWLRRFLDTALNFSTRVRWSRSLTVVR